MSNARWALAAIGATVIGALVTLAVVSGRPARSLAPIPREPARRVVPRSQSDLAWHLARFDHALSAGDHGRAAHQWREAYRAARRGRQWKPMVAAGAAAIRLGEALDDRQRGREDARTCYLAALFWARDADDLDGVVAAAAGFAALGDQAPVRQARQMAAGLPSVRDSPGARELLEREFARLVTAADPAIATPGQAPRPGWTPR